MKIKNSSLEVTSGFTFIFRWMGAMRRTVCFICNAAEHVKWTDHKLTCKKGPDLNPTTDHHYACTLHNTTRSILAWNGWIISWALTIFKTVTLYLPIYFILFIVIQQLPNLSRGRPQNQKTSVYKVTTPCSHPLIQILEVH